MEVYCSEKHYLYEHTECYLVLDASFSRQDLLLCETCWILWKKETIWGGSKARCCNQICSDTTNEPPHRHFALHVHDAASWPGNIVRLFASWQPRYWHRVLTALANKVVRRSKFTCVLLILYPFNIQALPIYNSLPFCQTSFFGIIFKSKLCSFLRKTQGKTNHCQLRFEYVKVEQKFYFYQIFT